MCCPGSGPSAADDPALRSLADRLEAVVAGLDPGARLDAVDLASRLDADVGRVGAALEVLVERGRVLRLARLRCTRCGTLNDPDRLDGDEPQCSGCGAGLEDAEPAQVFQPAARPPAPETPQDVAPEPEPAPGPPDPTFPSWAPSAGLAFGIATLVGLVVLILASSRGVELSEPLVAAFLALGVALSLGFLGGTAAVRGKLPLPGAERYPVTVSLAGGVAVFVVVFVVAWWAMRAPAPERPEVSYQVAPGTTLEEAILDLADRDRVTAAIDAGCGERLRGARLRPGEVRAADLPRLVASLASRVDDPQAAVRLNVRWLRSEGVVEVRCRE